MSVIDAPVSTLARDAPGRASKLRAELVPLADQPVSSASNFLLNSLVARRSTPGSFAAFTIATTGYLVLQGAARGGLYLRVLARPDRDRQEDAIAPMLGWVAAAAAAIGLVAGAVFVVGNSVVAALVCFFLPVLLLQDGQRFAAFARRRDTDALVSDAVWLLVTVALLVALRALGGTLTPAITTTLWLAGASSAVLVFVHRRYVPRVRGGLAGTQLSPRASVAGAFEFLVAASVTFGAPLVAAVWFGADGVSGMRASLVFFAPCLAFLPGVQTPVVRMLAHAGGERRRTQALLTLAVLAVVGPIVAAMLAARGTLGPLLLGQLWPSTVALVAPAACFVLARFVELPAYAGARVTAGHRALLSMRVVASTVIMTTFVGAMAAGATLVASYWTLAISAAVCALGVQCVRWSGR